MDINLGVKPKGYYDGARLEMLSFVPNDACRILEIGCGAGVFAGRLKAERRAEVWGVEMNKESAKKAMEKIDKIIIGDVESDNLKLPENYFDCVVFNDVLEHLKDPWKVLKNIRQSIAENGYVVASIPNIRYFPVLKKLLFHAEWIYEDEGVLDKTHLRFFTHKGIGDLFASCGYVVLKMEGIRSGGLTWKMKILNAICLNRFEDTQYPQFACQVKKHERNR